MPFEKGHQKYGSRKGIPNKTSKELKDMILGALDDVGGQKYLAQQAKENPGPFMTLVGRVLPKNIDVTGEIGIKKLTDEQLEETIAKLIAATSR
jgi:hypothetical protein